MNLINGLKNFSQQRIIVLGDVFLDKFRWGEIERINPEQPASPLVKITRETYALGGAGNVANNVSCLGAKCWFYGSVGRDLGGEKVKNLFQQERINYFVVEKKGPTIIKERIMAHGQQVARVDVGEEKKVGLSKELEKQILNELLNSERKDFIILSDYDKGFFNGNFAKEIISIAKSKKIPTLVDPKPQNISYFNECTIIRPNKKEASNITGINYENGERTLKKMAESLLEKTNSQYAIITCGKDGVFCYDKNKNKTLMVSTKAREVGDVTGAGDTFAATLAIGFSSGLGIFPASELANYAAGLAVERVGTVTIATKDLEKRLREDGKI